LTPSEEKQEAARLSHGAKMFCICPNKRRTHKMLIESEVYWDTCIIPINSNNFIK